MRVCILHASYEDTSGPFAEVDVAACDPRPYLLAHEVEEAFLRKASAVEQVRELADRGFDVFLNLCDGAADEDRAGLEVVETLEQLGQAFTGAGSAFYDPTREAMRDCGVRVPRGVFVAPGDDVAAAAGGLRFPLIVKHPAGYGSIGMRPESRVGDLAALAGEVARMMRAYGGALVEEFVEGREFTVLVADGPVAYAPVEVGFPDGESFKHFDLKWVDEGLEWLPVADPALASALQAISTEMFTALQGDGYGRVDIRMDATGELFALEINPNCGVFYPPPDGGGADVILGQEPGGHQRFTDALLARAIERRAACASAS